MTLNSRITRCRLCPRLVAWREETAEEKVKRFSNEEYWGKPLTGFGDPSAWLLLVGLAPAAHGGNRTGRMFTGDESGNWLFKALHRAGFANQPESLHREDGLRLTGCYITATLRCAPPQNKPTSAEIAACRPFLLEELTLLKNVRVVVGLGKVGFEAAIRAYREAGRIAVKKMPRFAHGASYTIGDLTFIASYHPSQQNTFTGKLTRAMLDGVFRKAKRAVSRQPHPPLPSLGRGGPSLPAGRQGGEGLDPQIPSPQPLSLNGRGGVVSLPCSLSPNRLYYKDPFSPIFPHYSPLCGCRAEDYVMEYLLILVVLILLVIAFEYRVRKPDHIVMYETRDGVGVRSGRLYPRHFSTSIIRSAHSFTQTIDASAKGNLDVRFKLAVTVALAMKQLASLVRVGGWNAGAVARAAKELEPLLLGYIKEYTEGKGIEELSSDGARTYLKQRTADISSTLGLEVVNLAVTSFDPVNAQIAEAIRQREHARILEQTEMLNQQARITAARARVKADEEVALLEHALELKRYDLKKAQLEQEAQLAESRTTNELELKRKQLEFEKEEMRLLKESPELLLLTPQAARLAEASQSLRNARTVVSLSPNETPQGNELLAMFHTFVQGAIDAYKEKKK
jgi:uracil-DNA glycosylase